MRNWLKNLLWGKSCPKLDYQLSRARTLTQFLSLSAALTSTYHNSLSATFAHISTCHTGVIGCHIHCIKSKCEQTSMNWSCEKVEVKPAESDRNWFPFPSSSCPRSRWSSASSRWRWWWSWGGFSGCPVQSGGREDENWLNSYLLYQKLNCFFSKCFQWSQCSLLGIDRSASSVIFSFLFYEADAGGSVDRTWSVESAEERTYGVAEVGIPFGGSEIPTDATV